MFKTIKNIKKFNEIVEKIEGLVNVINGFFHKFDDILYKLNLQAKELTELKEKLTGNKDN